MKVRLAMPGVIDPQSAYLRGCSDNHYTDNCDGRR